MYKTLSGKAPYYISSLVSHRRCSRSLRSSWQELLTVPLLFLKDIWRLIFLKKPVIFNFWYLFLPVILSEYYKILDF